MPRSQHQKQSYIALHLQKDIKMNIKWQHFNKKLSITYALHIYLCFFYSVGAPPMDQWHCDGCRILIRPPWTEGWSSIFILSLTLFDRHYLRHHWSSTFNLWKSFVFAVLLGIVVRNSFTWFLRPFKVILVILLTTIYHTKRDRVQSHRRSWEY